MHTYMWIRGIVEYGISWFESDGNTLLKSSMRE